MVGSVSVRGSFPRLSFWPVLARSRLRVSSAAHTTSGVRDHGNSTGRCCAAGAGSIRSHLATDEALNRYSTGDPNVGELAITHYEVIDQFSDAAIVRVQLETGRRNQIRVHFAEAGHPILGDPRYRTQEATHRFWPYSRLALHAESLGLTHPVTGEKLQYVAPWPQEFRDFRRKASRGA